MSETQLPERAQIVIIGGGVIGVSVAYHLTKLGWKDIVLLEQGQLSSGTTWHAAGLVGQLRNNANLTSLVRYSTELYTQLEAETGLATGWKNCGSVTVARTQERMHVLKRIAATARSQNVDCDVISAQTAGELWPAMRVDDVVGGVWLPGDGKANPTDLTQSLAKGARQGGAKIIERIQVTGINTKDGAVAGVQTSKGDIQAEYVVNCAGQWARHIGKMCGVSVPLHSAEHMYVVTGEIDGIHPDLPVMRDPDGFTYFKEEVGGLVVGGFEPEAKPWGMDGIPDNFEFALLPDDWDQFEILMENALHRIPQLETAEIRKFYNGPESFTPDNNFLMGEAPELRNFFVGAGFNSTGIACAGGAGKALAEWIVNGSPTIDLFPVDIRRFANFNNNGKLLHDRVKEVLGLHYMMPWPNRELETARPFRQSPIYDRLAAKGACFGSKMGWERANWFSTDGTKPETKYSFDKQNWFEAVKAEQDATRNDVAIFDQTSFAKLKVQGRDAAKLLNRLCAAQVDVAIGQTVYTGMLNEAGGYESDLTVMRLAENDFLLVTGSAQAVRDANWINRNMLADEHAFLTDVTSAFSIFSVMGPKSRELLQRVSTADFPNKSFPFATFQEIELGYATVLANRMTYVGELGWELCIPTEFATGVYDILHDAGRDLGLRDCGYYALDGLRIEKGFRAWSRELTPDVNPYEAGLGFAVSLEKPMGFIGQNALRKAKIASKLTKRIVQFTVDDAGPVFWSGELILRDGMPVGEVRSAGYGFAVGRSVLLALIENQEGINKTYIEEGHWEVDIAGDKFSVTPHLRTPYDPRAERVKIDA